VNLLGSRKKLILKKAIFIWTSLIKNDKKSSAWKCQEHHPTQKKQANPAW